MQQSNRCTCTRDYQNALDYLQWLDRMVEDTQWLEANLGKRWRCSDTNIPHGYRRTYYFVCEQDLVLFKLSCGDQ